MFEFYESNKSEDKNNNEIDYWFEVVFIHAATLSSQYITIPPSGSYTHIAALLDVDFKAGCHHMVYAAAGGQ